MSRRKHPKLHIPFDSFRDVDRIEICAHRQGEKPVPWARKALLAQARAETMDTILRSMCMRAVLEILYILRELAGPDVTQRAAAKVEDTLRKAESDASQELE